MKKNDAPPIDLVEQIASESLNKTVKTIERELRGVSTYVYRVQLEDRTVYLRILPEEDCSFAVEVQVHSLLREKGVLVPEVIFFAPHQHISGMSFMIVGEIPGENVMNCGSKDIYHGILVQAGKQIAVINQVSVDGFGFVKRGREEDARPLQGPKKSMHDYLYEVLEEGLVLLSENGFSRRDIFQISSLFDAGADLMGRHGSCLAHGDFDDDHIFHYNGTFTGIIDFGEIQGSSPLYDLGHFKLHDGQYNQITQGFPSLAMGYNEVVELSDDDYTEIDLWALWIGVGRLARKYKYNRRNSKGNWGRYHDHLLKTVKIEMELLANKI
ncbi:aminoglycoside phosphotransferase family protein [Paenibacillus doosanensis]|uniref:phosphotransferase family protein n=1 Tax=Paenibacillus doosanensis TaxID=1229154 RepID=UPI00218054F3|nr:aminoglycoside phosphotransferase family protein [Paenibacillus doosanensis]MCS7461531.1 aminoglycoside phosphotransferase family protein [Paenibacillus doosanensis]